MHYQTLRKKPTKPRQKVHRQVNRETSSNYKSPKSKPADPPPHNTNVHAPSTPAPGDPFVHAVHPSIMQNLLKQQPQTFDVPQEKETEQYEQGPTTWQSQGELQNSNGQGLKSFHSDFGSQGHVDGQQENYDVSKRPIYVPNRVSVQSPSSDTSFNVGYSIGFGNGLAQPPRIGIVQPPVNLRHGKQLSLPASYQNIPVNVHIDGKNSVWKNMGSGVEMSHTVGSKYESPNPASNGDSSDRHVYSSGSVINQPIFFREGFDHNFHSIPTSGRNNFDHNHALQQSNSFDFSNAIDPMTHHSYSTEQKSNQFSSSLQPSFAESFSKQPASSFTESFSKHPHSSYSETFTKQLKPSSLRNQHNYEGSNVESPQYTHAVISQNDHSESTEGKESKYEKPNLSTGLFGPGRTPNSLNLNLKQKLSDFSKGNPGVAKSSYSFKTFGNSNNGLNSINDEMFGNSFGFQSSPAIPSIYSHPGKIAHPGMVQAILVPVNSPPPSLSYPLGMPLLGNGYSPYFGQPVGMVRIPEPVGVNNLPSKEEYESTAYNTNTQEENKQHNYQQSPVKVVQTHYATRHQKVEAQDSQHHLTRPNSHPRLGDVPERSPKFKRVYSTEAPDHAPSLVKSYSQSSSHSPTFESSSFKEQSSFSEPSSQYSSFKEQFPSYSSLKETPSPHYPITAHHPRPYRTKKLVIVKRS